MYEATDAVTVSPQGAIAQVAFNVPEQLNALTDAMRVTFVKVMRALDADVDIRAIVVTGEGRAFSAGGDARDILRLHEDPGYRRWSMTEAQTLVDGMVDLRTPVVAAVNGPAVGLGATVALLCDIVLIADTAWMADPHVSVGLVAGDGGAMLWPLLMSLLRAKEYLFTGDRLSAEQAVEFGLANRVVPHAELLEQAHALANRLAAQPAQALADTKRAINLLLRQSAATVLPFSLAAEWESCASQEVRDFATRMMSQ